MRHVTDGELHAFLDGAMDILPGERGKEVRDHLSSCPVCRERLQDEELVRSQAKGILGDPALGKLALPTFEELRERAEAPGSDSVASSGESDTEIHYRGPMRGLSLAWAATIVLALGVGWMGGQVWKTLPSDGRPGSAASRLESIEAPGALLVDLKSEASQPDEPQPSRLDLEAVPARREEEEEGVGAPTALDLLPEMASEARIRSVAQEPRAASPEVEQANLAPTEGTEGDLLISGSLENSLVVPGLKVVSMEWEERGPGERILHIRQLLSPGDTLELRYLGMLLGTDPEPREGRERELPVEEALGGRAYANVLEASLPLGWNQVVMEWRRGLLVARAPISEANLKALLKTLH
jgi:hypothetical protein